MTCILFGNRNPEWLGQNEIASSPIPSIYLHNKGIRESSWKATIFRLFLSPLCHIASELSQVVQFMLTKKYVLGFIHIDRAYIFMALMSFLKDPTLKLYIRHKSEPSFSEECLEVMVSGI